MFKSLWIFGLLICVCTFSEAQSIAVNYNSIGSGRNVTATVSKTIAGTEIGAGIGYNINSLSHPDDKGHAYYKRLHATEPGHFLNFEVFVHQAVLKGLKNIQPFFFYDLQIKHSTIRNRGYSYFQIDPTVSSLSSDLDYAYQEYEIIRGPFTWFENSFGLGFRVDVSNRFFIQEKMGLGMFALLDNDPRYAQGPRVEWEFMGLIQAGLGYRFGAPLK